MGSESSSEENKGDCGDVTARRLFMAANVSSIGTWKRMKVAADVRVRVSRFVEQQ